MDNDEFRKAIAELAAMESETTRYMPKWATSLQRLIRKSTLDTDPLIEKEMGKGEAE